MSGLRERQVHDGIQCVLRGPAKQRPRARHAELPVQRGLLHARGGQRVLRVRGRHVQGGERQRRAGLLGVKASSVSPAATISAASCLCVQGYAADGSALDTCVECTKGKYKAASANAACDTCPVGSTTLADKAFDLSLCVAAVGFFNNNGLFEACAVGSFKPQEGDVACTPCQTHSTTPEEGAEASSECVCVAPNTRRSAARAGARPASFTWAPRRRARRAPRAPSVLERRRAGRW